MDDSRGMGVSQGIGDGDAVTERLVDLQPPAMHHAIERLSVDALHDQEVEIALAADVVHGADVRVVQRGDDAGLAGEAIAGRGVDDSSRRSHSFAIRQSRITVSAERPSACAVSSTLSPAK